jgi:hypothetical protein
MNERKRIIQMDFFQCVASNENKKSDRKNETKRIIKPCSTEKLKINSQTFAINFL